jgi:hypothetical protein
MAPVVRKRAAWVVRVTALAVLVLGVPAGIAVAHLTSTERAALGAPPSVHNRDTGRRDHRPAHTAKHQSHPGPVVNAGPGLQALHAAVSKTLAVSNYDLTFTLSETGGPASTRPETSGPATNFSGGGGSSRPAPEELGATGSGVADLDPQALSVLTYPGCWRSGVSLRIDGENVFEDLGVTDPTQPPPVGAFGGGSDLDGFQATVAGCLGTELGALATIAMCSPSGQLALSQQAISGATPVGTVTVNGEPAEEYSVTIDPAGFLQQPNSTPEENTAIQGALAVIGSNEIAATVDVDNAGYIVEMDLSVSYADGVTATHTIDLSNFDGAGTIVMPPLREGPSATGNACGPGVACPPVMPSGAITGAVRTSAVLTNG